MLFVAETLSNDAFGFVASNGFSDIFFGNNYSQSRVSKTIVASEYKKVTVMNFKRRGVKNGRELAGVKQSMRLLEFQCRRQKKLSLQRSV